MLEVPDQGPTGSLSREDCIPGLQLANFLLCPHMAENKKKKKQLSGVSYYKVSLITKTRILSNQGCILMTSFNLITY